MSQDFPDVLATDLISESRQPLLNRDAALQSNFAGNDYPTTNLTEGMLCWRLDLQKLYVLQSTGPSIWEEVAQTSALGTASGKNTGTSGNTVPLLDGVNTWSGAQTFSAGITLSGQTITGTSGSITINTDLRLNANSSKDINLMVNSVSRAKLNSDGGFTVGAPTGDSQGAGSINAQSIYLNGTALGSGATANVGTSGDAVVKANTANTWSADQTISKTAPTLKLNSTVASNTWDIQNNSGTFSILLNGSGVNAFQVTTNSSIVCGGATGGAQGAGTINCKGLYVDGEAITGGANALVPEYFTSSGTWTKPSGYSGYVRVTVTGGGGGGRGLSGNGGTGGTSSFGTHLTAAGGYGGTSTDGYMKAGRIASGGDENYDGGPSIFEMEYHDASTSVRCRGGDSFRGRGGLYSQDLGPGATIAASGKGSGGRSLKGDTSIPSIGCGTGAATVVSVFHTDVLGATETVTVGAGGVAGSGNNSSRTGEAGTPGEVIVEYLG